MPFTIVEQEVNLIVQEQQIEVLEIDENTLDLVIQQVESTTLVREDRVAVIEVNTGLMGPPGQSVEQAIELVIGDGTGVITTGIKGDLEVPFDCMILGWTLVGDIPGDIIVDIWKSTYAAFPPVLAGSITGTEKPTLVAQQINRDFALTTWDNALLQGDWLRVNIDSAAVVRQVTISLRVQKN